MGASLGMSVEVQDYRRMEGSFSYNVWNSYQHRNVAIRFLPQLIVNVKICMQLLCVSLYMYIYPIVKVLLGFAVIVNLIQYLLVHSECIFVITPP